VSGKRLGRRPGTPTTREAVLTSARATFASAGFAGTTIRAIAADAGVDPALVHHYFGSKRGLFLAAVNVSIDLGAVVESVLAGPRGSVGSRIARTVLGLWDSESGAALVAALRSAIGDPGTARPFREFVVSEVIGRVLSAIECPPAEADLRGSLMASQILGVITGRHVLALEPLASQSVEELVPPLGATLQHYLTGPVT
jgi:AcrR family transcriptional regulator